jgi:hypothetical protein
VREREEKREKERKREKREIIKENKRERERSFSLFVNQTLHKKGKTRRNR